MAWPPLIMSGLTCAAVILATDVLSRNVLTSASLPVGVVTGTLGAPVLLWMLIRRLSSVCTPTKLLVVQGTE